MTKSADQIVLHFPRRVNDLIPGVVTHSDGQVKWACKMAPSLSLSQTQAEPNPGEEERAKREGERKGAEP